MLYPSIARFAWWDKGARLVSFKEVKQNNRAIPWVKVFRDCSVGRIALSSPVAWDVWGWVDDRELELGIKEPGKEVGA